ncbi:MAG: orotidine 5'-phosphate decarboxylase [Anaerolineales bacterium]|nr:MAG: orotidine 5'-phosphate decarboxylase [Anaerolineales bacterium]
MADRKLDHRQRYLQIAFNYDLAMAYSVIPRLPRNERILIEAGTPFIKREGMRGVRAIRGIWPGHLVADIKTSDGAAAEVDMVREAGADAITVLGNAPTETLDLFAKQCDERGLISMVDLLGVGDPLAVLRPLRHVPDVVVLHKGRDEEKTRGKVIEYRHVNRIRSKYDVSIAAAGGVDLDQARSAIFNGANIVVVNLVNPGDPWQGISTSEDIGAMARKFLETIE